MNRPIYLIRPDDYHVFSLNEDKETYSSYDSKVQFPNNLHDKYRYEVLINSCFIPCFTDAELYKYEIKRNEYYLNNRFKYDSMEIK